VTQLTFSFLFDKVFPEKANEKGRHEVRRTLQPDFKKKAY
jgi:hypothetical protein